MDSVFENCSSLVLEMEVESEFSSAFCDYSSDESEKIQTPCSEIDQMLFLRDSIISDGSVSSSETICKYVTFDATQKIPSSIVDDAVTTSSKIHDGSYSDCYIAPGAISLRSSTTMAFVEPYSDNIPLHVYPCLRMDEPGTLDDPILDLFDLYKQPTIRPVLASVERDTVPLPFEDGPPPYLKPTPVAYHVRNVIKTKSRFVAHDATLTNNQPRQYMYSPIAPRSIPLRSTIQPRFNRLAEIYSENFAPGHYLLPSFLRKYSLEAEIGTGGYGFVMAARIRETGQEVAVKFMLKSKVPRYRWYKSKSGRILPKEVCFLSVVEHENIVKLVDYYEDTLYCYVVSDGPFVKQIFFIIYSHRSRNCMVTLGLPGRAV